MSGAKSVDLALDYDSNLKPFRQRSPRSERDHDTARDALVDFYLSAEHRDQPGTGCPTAGFAGDVAHETTAGEVRETYAAGVEEFASRLSTDTNDGLPMVATAVGALLPARATAGTELPERILESTRAAMTAPHNRCPSPT